jgi:hypothetical protein
MKKIQSVLYFLTVTLFAQSQTTFYDLGTIQKIEVYFSQPNWDYQMDTAKHGSEGYTLATWVKVNGVQFDSVGVKYKGNSSYDSTYTKNPIHIELDNFRSQSYQGIKDIKLGNGYADPSLIREVLSYNILQNYMHCPRANFAQLYINGAYIGLYSNAESINKKFCSEHFYSSGNTFIKCNPILNPGPNTKSNLKYINADSSSYLNYYEVKSTYGWSDLVKLCDTVSNYSTSASSVVDIDRLIWMLAFNSVLVNLDSYTGVFAQNYYMYKDNTSHYNPIVWDLNMSFGGFPFVGSGNTSMGSLSIANMQQLPATFHATDTYWPLINIVMNNPMYKRMYFAHARTIVSEIFANNNYLTTAAQLQSTIDTAAQSDANNFFSYSQFQNGVTTNYPFGSYTIPCISTLMSTRVTYLQSTAEFTATQPTISNIVSSNDSPALNTAVNITAVVINANTDGVYFGFRFDASNKFQRVQMFDDGTHNDGSANDNVFGTSFNMAGTFVQYYIYAENNNAGTFSPARAEHEYYILQSAVPTAQPGQVFINEFMASNTSAQQNEYNQYEDWIELYNSTNTPLSLYGLYITDNFSNRTKYAFPQNTIIQPNNVLVIWADEEASSSTYLHCNFKLSASGEQLMLSNTVGAVLDSITFGVQEANKSLGRCPDGTGEFMTLYPSKFNELNCATGIFDEVVQTNLISVFPNPASNTITILLLNNDAGTTTRFLIFNMIGTKITEGILSSTHQTINVSDFPAGIYFIRAEGFVTQKFVIQKP